MADRRLRWSLVLILVACYMLIYINRPDSADGEAILALSASLVRHGSLEIGIVGAQDALFERDMSRMGVFGHDGAYYSKKGVTPSLLLMPLVALAQVTPWLPTRATAMLLNPLVTALTSALLYTLLRTHAFRPRVAWITALVYGLATTAAVYTKTLYGEPLAGLLVLMSVYAVERRLLTAPRIWSALAGSALGLAAGVNMSYLLLAAVLGSYLLVRLKPDRSIRLRAWVNDGLAFGLPILAALAAIGIYNALRFGSPFDSGYYFESGEGFNRPLLPGLFGLFLSPYRGLFWYTPVLLAALLGIGLLRRRLPAFAVLISLLVAVQAATYAMWWSWHGGYVWGPRFLVPVLPLFAVGLAPIIQLILGDESSRASVMGMTFGLLAFLSFLVQALGSLISIYPHVGFLVTNYGTGVFNSLITSLRDEVMFDPSLSPLVGHARLLLQQHPLDPAWLASGLDPIIPLLSLMLVFLAWLMLRSKRGVLLPGWLGLLCVLFLVPARQTADVTVQEAIALQEVLDPAVPVFVASTHYADALLDVERNVVYSANAPTQPADPLALGMWQQALDRSSALWFVSWFPPADPANWQERALWETAAFAVERTVAGHRALLFHDPVQSERINAGWQFGSMRLLFYEATKTDEGIFVTLEWQPNGPITTDDRWFVHVLNGSDEIVAQQDRPPLGGYHPTPTWEPNEIITDRLWFLIEDVSATNWQLRLGWVDSLTGSLRPVVDPSGRPLPDGFVLLPIDSGLIP